MSCAHTSAAEEKEEEEANVMHWQKPNTYS